MAERLTRFRNFKDYKTYMIEWHCPSCGQKHTVSLRNLVRRLRMNPQLGLRCNNQGGFGPDCGWSGPLPPVTSYVVQKQLSFEWDEPTCIV